MENNRSSALRLVQEYDFAVYEAVLFLDGHPDDVEALEYYNKYRNLLKEAVNNYEKKYGPLTTDGVNIEYGHWTWVNEPWPWEFGAE